MAEPIDVVAVMPRLAGGGAERVVANLLTHIDLPGGRKELVVFHDGATAKRMLPPEIKVNDLHRPRLREAILPLTRWLRARKPDIVFSSLHNANLGLLAVRGLLPRRTCLVVRESNLPSLCLPHLPYGRVLAHAYRYLYPKADAIVCPSQAIKSDLTKNYGVPADRSLILPNPIEIERLRSAAKDPVRTSGSGARYVAVGRLTAAKGFDRLLDLFARQETGARLTIVGNGPERTALEAQAGRLGLASSISFVGRQENPWKFMSGADALLLPSRWEGVPNVALEALACGTPVICTPTSGLNDFAARLPDGVITVADIGDAYLHAMTAAPVNDRPGLRPCLLPSDFAVDRATRKFAQVFEKVVVARRTRT